MTSSLLVTPSGKPRARSLGIPFDGRPGPNNAITDVSGVEVGYCTLIRGEGGPLVVGEGPVRTGVTAIIPRGKARAQLPVWTGQFSLNGNGELTGSWWISEVGHSDGPITITNTHSCGVSRDATIEWMNRNVRAYGDGPDWGLPVAGETWDGWLNDINGFHVTKEHVFEAIDSRHRRPDRGRQCRRRHRHDALRSQGRVRNVVTPGRLRGRDLHRRSVRSGELRPAFAAADRRHTHGGTPAGPGTLW